MLVTFPALKQGELSRVVHHRELLQQSLDDLTGRRVGADVQMLGRVLGQVEGRAALDSSGLLPSSFLSRRPLSGRRDRDGARQLELHLHKASVGTVSVLY